MSVAAKAAKGAAWNLATGVVVRAFGLVGTLLLTRFIAPAEYGEVSAAAVCILTATRFTNFGFGSYVVAKKAAPDEAFQAMLSHVSATSVGVIAVAVLGDHLARGLGAPGMGRFLPGLGLAAIIQQASIIPSATLVRSLRFRTVAVTRSVGEVAFTVVAVGLAPILGGFAIVAGNLARSTLVSATLLMRSDRSEWFMPARPNAATTRRLLGFGIPVWGATLLDTAASNWDSLLVLRFFGPGTMGQYQLANNLAHAPMQVTENISDVFLPSFARVEDARRRRGVIRAAGLMALIMFPLALGLAAVAPTLVTSLLDPRWHGVAPMLAILCGVAVLRSLRSVGDSYVVAAGKPGLLVILEALKVALVLGLISTLGRLGPLWACGAATLALIIHYAVSLLALGRVTGISTAAFVRQIIPPLVAGGVMSVVVVLTREGLATLGLKTGLLMLLTEVLLGGVAYAAVAILIARPAVEDLIGIVRDLLARRTASPGALQPE